jgi:hypothetical protein
MNPFIQITHLTDKGRETLTFDISEDQRQQIMSLIETPNTETTTTEDHPPRFRYEELNSYDGHKAIFAIQTTSSNEDPNFTNSSNLFHNYHEAFKEYTKVTAEVGTIRNLNVLFPSPFQSNPLLTLNQWNEHSPTAKILYTETNRGNKLYDHNIIVVVNQDNHIEDIRPPFKTEQYEDDIIDYTECFQRHLVTSHIDHGNREDIITYALSLVGIQPDGEGFEVSKVVLLNSMMHKNFPE